MCVCVWAVDCMHPHCIKMKFIIHKIIEIQVNLQRFLSKIHTFHTNTTLTQRYSVDISTKLARNNIIFGNYP